MFPGRGSAETEVRAQLVHDEVRERLGREQVTLRLPDLAGDTAPRLQRQLADDLKWLVIPDHALVREGAPRGRRVMITNFAPHHRAAVPNREPRG